MADEEETAAPTYSVEYLGAGKNEEPIGWLSKAGKANVKYTNGDSYCGEYNELKQRHGRGRYTYVRKLNEEDEEAPSAIFVYDGDFRLGKKHGMGSMTYADGSVYNGSWENDKRHAATEQKLCEAVLQEQKENDALERGCIQQQEDICKLKTLVETSHSEL